MCAWTSLQVRRLAQGETIRGSMEGFVDEACHRAGGAGLLSVLRNDDAEISSSPEGAASDSEYQMEWKDEDRKAPFGSEIGIFEANRGITAQAVFRRGVSRLDFLNPDFPLRAKKSTIASGSSKPILGWAKLTFRTSQRVVHEQILSLWQQTGAA